MGFHKTGTSTIQQLLRINRETLKPHMRSLLRWSLKELVSASRGYSTWRDPITLLKFTHRFDRLLADLNGMPNRVLCLSAEELSGHLPGRDTLQDYGAAPILAAEMAAMVHTRFPDATLAFFLTTRDPDAWIKSAYWQHVKSSSLTLEFNAFQTAYPNAADLDAIVDQIAASVSCPVIKSKLEDCASGPLGPAGPLLDLCEVPEKLRQNIQPVAPANTRLGDDVLQQLLAANRKYTDREARDAAKKAILDHAHKRPT
jgi:hypothetical protein